jgi:hypothetical protein
MASFLAPRWSSLIFAFSFASSLTSAYGQVDTCMPSIEIEINTSLPSPLLNTVRPITTLRPPLTPSPGVTSTVRPHLRLPWPRAKPSRSR